MNYLNQFCKTPGRLPPISHEPLKWVLWTVPDMATRINTLYAGHEHGLYGIEAASAFAIKSKFEIKSEVSGSEILKLQKEDASRLRLFFPGGVCSLWDQDISELARSRLKMLVEEGAEFIGICAGAYYLCRKVRFKGPGEVMIERKRVSQAVFQGIGVGPLYEDNVPGTESFCPQITTLQWKDGKTSKAIMGGGGYFVPSEKDVEGKTYEVIATYADQPSDKSLAIIRCFYGKGSATLCFPHLEWGLSEVQSVCSILEKSEDARSIAFSEFTDEAGFIREQLKRLCRSEVKC